MLSVTDPTPLAAPPARFNMAAHVLQHAERLGPKRALEVVDETGTHGLRYYDSILTGVKSVATGFRSLCKPGDRILLEIGNSWDFSDAFLGAITAGMVPVLISDQLTEAELHHVRKVVQPDLIVRKDGAGQIAGNVIHEQSIRDFSGLAESDFDLGDPNRPAYIVFTSGTSGTPRAVVHAHRAIWARQMMWNGWYGLREDDVIMHAGAFNWTYTLGTGLMDPWSIGATAIIPREDTPTEFLPFLMAEYGVTIFAAAPGVYRRLLRADIPALPALRHGLSAGEKLAEDYRKDWEAKTGTPIHEAFGMSECSTFISGSPARPAPPGTSGYPQPGRKVAIIGTDGPVARGQQGTIGVHKSDPGLMLGYLDAPADTANRFQGDWFLTGDIGIMHDDGAITYAGRTDDMMNAGGYRVSPIEVENVLTAHPAITEAAACAVQVRTGTSIIAAFYVATDVIDEDKLRAFTAGQLAGYKCPRLYIAKDSLPRGANNKLLRRILRTEWETAHGQT